MPLDCDGYDARMLSPPEISSSYTPLPMRGVEDGGEDDRERDGRGGDCSAGELELGLSLRSGVAAASKANAAAPWGDYCRILTAKDFPSPAAASAYGSAAQQRRNKPGYDAGVDNGSNASSPVVGWPPLRAFRINSLFNHSKDNGCFSDEENADTNQKKENKKSPREGKEDGGGETGFNNRKGTAAAAPVTSNAAPGKKRSGSLFVKVKMDGMPIGRKVNLSAHQSYEALALALEDMFQVPSIPKDSSMASSLLDGSSEFVLTYEDRDGDWMLVGDVPWGMFVGTARRLRIMRTTDANGLATTSFHPVHNTQN